MKKFFVLVASIVLGLTLLGWLCFSNNIMGHIVGESLPQEESFDSFKTNANARCAVDAINVSNNIFGTMQIAGWAFAETTEDSSNRNVELVLKSDTYCYSVQLSTPGNTFSGKRPDVQSAFSNLNLNIGDVGITAEFPTYNMEDGTYDAYFYCWENESSYGLVHIGSQIVKEGTDFFLMPVQNTTSIEAWMSETAILDGSPLTEESVQYCLDVIDINDGVFSVTGWAFQDGLDCSNQTVYLSVNNTPYTTQSIERGDVAAVYQNNLYTASGFHAGVSLEQIPEGELTVQVLIENNGELYSSESVLMMRTGDTIEKTEVEQAEQTPTNTEVWTSEAVVLEGAPAEDGTARATLDTLRAENEMLVVLGWVFQNGLDCAGQTVYFSINGTTYTTQPIERPDVAEVYENELYTESGFGANIPLDQVPEGNLTVQVLIENNGTFYSAPAYVSQVERVT